MLHDFTGRPLSVGELYLIHVQLDDPPVVHLSTANHPFRLHFPVHALTARHTSCDDEPQTPRQRRVEGRGRVGPQEASDIGTLLDNDLFVGTQGSIGEIVYAYHRFTPIRYRQLDGRVVRHDKPSLETDVSGQRLDSAGPSPPAEVPVPLPRERSPCSQWESKRSPRPPGYVANLMPSIVTSTSSSRGRVPRTIASFRAWATILVSPFDWAVTSAWIMSRSSVRTSPLRYCGSRSAALSTETSVMNPTRPMFIPTIGMEYGAASRFTRMIVPSPPAVTIRAVDRRVSGSIPARQPARPSSGHASRESRQVTGLRR